MNLSNEVVNMIPAELLRHATVSMIPEKVAALSYKTEMLQDPATLAAFKEQMKDTEVSFDYCGNHCFVITRYLTDAAYDKDINSSAAKMLMEISTMTFDAEKRMTVAAILATDAVVLEGLVKQAIA